MNPIESTLSALGVLLTTLFSSKIFVLVAQATNAELPGWMSQLIGPFGAFVGLVVGIIWMAKRLDRSEAKFEARDKERDEIIKSVVALTTQTSLVIEQNSEILRDVQTTLKK